MKYTLVLEQPMLAQIIDLIANGPYKIAAPILAELQRQVDAQVQVLPEFVDNGRAGGPHKDTRPAQPEQEPPCPTPLRRPPNKLG